ncbi:MAG TPA: hypothetical protein VGR00_03710, partial [Thermoanaerobaculia bacterium]|nr:hypothetical protein [Thermoanaerobaculia bacterium]
SEGKPIPVRRPEERVVNPMEYGLPAIQEGLRGVVRLPGGTAHSLDSPDFPIPVMGKTGTTNDFRDALFVGSTYGPDGITVAVRLGFDDNRALGEKETGARMALPVFKEVMQKVYGRSLAGAVPQFPAEIERGIDGFVALAAQRAEEAELARQQAANAAAGTEPLVGTDPAADPTHPRPILGRVPSAEAAPAGGPEERPAPPPSRVDPQPSPASSPVTRRELVQPTPVPALPPAESVQPAQNVE